MKKDLALTQESFDELLAWLAPDREEAGKKYEEIRQGLIRFFRFRGCNDSSALADETINRVAAKISTFKTEEDFKTITYFYGFASKIYLEQTAQRKKKEVQLEPDLPLRDKHSEDSFEEENRNQDCLEDCLSKLSPLESDIILTYYSQEKSAKFELRKRMAEKMNLKPGALHVKIHRIRNVLKECVEKCIDEK